MFGGVWEQSWAWWASPAPTESFRRSLGSTAGVSPLQNEKYMVLPDTSHRRRHVGMILEPGRMTAGRGSAFIPPRVDCFPLNDTTLLQLSAAPAARSNRGISWFHPHVFKETSD